MKRNCLFIMLVGLLPWSIAMKAPSEAERIEQDKAVIRETIYDSIGWALTKDRARLESILWHDPDLFIFHPGWAETIVGWDSFEKLFDVWMDPRFVATHFNVRDLRISLSDCGHVAWFSSILDDCGEWEGKKMCWKDTRWTGVLERRDGSWRITQMHFSFAADRVLADAQREQAKETNTE